MATLVAMQSFAVSATDLSGSANVSVTRLIALSEDTPMSFGVIATDSRQCFVELSPAGDVTCSNRPYQFSGSPAPATFTVFGNPNTPETIVFSSGDTLTGPGAAMDLDNFQHDAGASPVLDGSGWLTFNVGARLRVRNNQANGIYTGTFTLTVNYQ